MILPMATSGFSSTVPQGLQMLPAALSEYLVSSLSPSVEINTISGSGLQSSSLLFYLSVLKDKLSQLQILLRVGVTVSPQHTLPDHSPSMQAISTMNSIIHQIIVAANSMNKLITSQEMMMMPLGSTTPGSTCTDQQLHQQHSDLDHRLPPAHQYSNFGNNNGGVLISNNMFSDIRRHSFFSSTEAEAVDWLAESYNNNNNNLSNSSTCNIKDDDRCVEVMSEANNSRGGIMSSGDETDIIELDVADLFARYKYFCQVCGKGFKRDANLRMHMRAHGDVYKTTAALSNPMKNKGSLLGGGGSTGCFMNMKPKKYSCPQEGCRWNQKHARFQPLKSMACVKNHYKRSHCPKMYVCKRCNQKQFSLLCDLRTHEKRCGDPGWH